MSSVLFENGGGLLYYVSDTQPDFVSNGIMAFKLTAEHNVLKVQSDFTDPVQDLPIQFRYVSLTCIASSISESAFEAMRFVSVLFNFVVCQRSLGN